MPCGRGLSMSWESSGRFGSYIQDGGNKDRRVRQTHSKTDERHEEWTMKYIESRHIGLRVCVDSGETQVPLAVSLGKASLLAVI